ncbi:MAG: hypothetical protein COS47_00830 [Candidatus Nealsonbacteria bacterium CG03_land_8_20_14_0_80_36_12]|uniref:Mur ligase central domain-containing protein n=1 Tax=Candidatus Nealsonbacteria bacterium CG03_land_8_20_14_0_80_36_12 TaxID=1974701 RepID=A0A2M7BYL2_9BACT|nr:MAG: hypothetical protein COS47_00830 [Candidatus Nealsonbacteria bacterium CG03_land_8_20_14_0_80_36_12]
MKFLFLFLWLAIISKKLSFWIWLWQLKEYHLGRFLAHFQTAKGKELIINQLLTVKLFLILGLFFYFPIFFPILILVYFLETLFTFRHLLKRTFKFPVFTKKALFLLFFGFCLIVLIFGSFWKKPLSEFTIFLLISDILALGIFSGLVLFFQPLTFFWQRIIIQKAKRKREKFKDLISIGITGSYGKTSTKEFLAEILSEKYKVLKTKEHQNSEVGISLCILKELKPEHHVFVCEMGAYQRGGIRLLSSIVKPKIGILTGLNEQHMATFGSQENIIKTKFELIESLPNNGLAIFNGNDKNCHELYNRRSDVRKLEIGARRRNKLDIWAENIAVEKESLSFKVFCRDGEEADFKLNLIGTQNVENILLAACCAKELGMNLKEIAGACQKIKPQEKTMKLKRGKGDITIIDDSYSANPQGVISALDYLKIYSGKKIIIIPCLIELGPASKEVHKRIGEKIGQVCDLAIITTEDRFKEIKEEAIGKGMKEENILFIENPQKIFEKVREFSNEDDVILLEGRIPNQLLNLLIR